VTNQLGLDRDKLICMATLLGSDYTEGVRGVGIVNAIEIVNAFPGFEGLVDFKKWVFSTSHHLDPGNAPPRLPSFASAAEIAANEAILRQFRLDYFKFTHRNIRRTWSLSSDFPPMSAIQAYQHPTADRSTEPFSWGRVDTQPLIDFLVDRLSMNPQDAQRTLRPVLEAAENPFAQSRLETFFTADTARVASITSTRVERAVMDLTGAAPTADLESDKVVAQEQPAQPAAHSKRKKAHPPRSDEEDSSYSDNDNQVPFYSAKSIIITSSTMMIFFYNDTYCRYIHSSRSRCVA
jgi:DNA excision repair protein ERCC-5